MPQLDGEASAAPAGQPQGSAAAATLGGIVIPIAAAPLVAIALPVALFLSWWILEELLGRPVSFIERQRGGMQMLADVVAATSVGAIAAALAGVPLVKYLFGSARPDLLFRIGAVGMLVVAILFWLWISRNVPDRRFDLAWAAALGWIGSLLGLKIATWETEEAKRTKAAEDESSLEKSRSEIEEALAADLYPSVPNAGAKINSRTSEEGR